MSWIDETDSSELFEVAYKWILPPPKRDVRALCAKQSLPGSTKKREKKKKLVPAPASESVPVASESQPTSSHVLEETKPQASAPPPTIPQPQPAALPLDWSARNPGLAQYHQYVWRQNTQNPSPDAGFQAILQRLQATPPPPTSLSSPPPQQLAPQSSQGSVSPGAGMRNIVLPPPNFGMPKPPLSLLGGKPSLTPRPAVDIRYSHSQHRQETQQSASPPLQSQAMRPPPLAPRPTPPSQYPSLSPMYPPKLGPKEQPIQQSRPQFPMHATPPPSPPQSEPKYTPWSSEWTETPRSPALPPVTNTVPQRPAQTLPPMLPQPPSNANQQYDFSKFLNNKSQAWP